MGPSRYDFESSEVCGGMESSGYLASAPTDPVDKLSLRDDRRDFVSVGFVARSDDRVEIEGVARHHDVAVETRRGEAQVEVSQVVFAAACVRCFEVSEDVVEGDVVELVCFLSWFDGCDDGVDLGFSVAEGVFDACDGSVDVELYSVLFG